MQLDPVSTQERHEERVEGERHTTVDVVHEGDSFITRRSWSGFRPGNAPHVLGPGAEEAFAFKVAETHHRACALEPPRGASLLRVVLLAGGRALPGGLLHHCHGVDGKVQ